MAEPLKTRGLVVRTANSRDNDRVLTVLTDSLGKISISARGVRSLKNNNRAACSPLCYSEFLIAPRGEMYTLSQASVLEPFRALSEDVFLLAYASYFAALTSAIVPPAQGCAEELRLLLNTLYVLCCRGEADDLLKCTFELRLLDLSGLSPRGELALSPGGNAMADYILDAPLKDALFFRASKEQQPAVASLCRGVEAFLCIQLGARPKTLDYLHELCDPQKSE